METQSALHVHLDPVGGIAGDMFVAALLDAWPALAPRTLGAVQVLMPELHELTSVVAWNDGVLQGSRFIVKLNACASGEASASTQAHPSHHHDWLAVRTLLEGSELPAGVKGHAIGIFSELAQAEAQVHGSGIDSVCFHEVGNRDSIADIVAAAALIDVLEVCSWSVGSLPIGQGRVSTAHGELPVPAPATTVLLQGLQCHDDTRKGERVTPTGAAILRYLQPANSIGPVGRTLVQAGYGFGSRLLPGISNVLRAMAFNDVPPAAKPGAVS